jgi:ABC-2 type transport system ATP-binding protein
VGTPSIPVLAGVRKRYARHAPWVLDGVSLDVERGARTLILGANGSGKSTLLGVVAGVVRPSAGSAHPPLGVGYVPERLPAVLRMTALEYLTHMGRIRGMGPRSVDSRAAELLERLQLEPGPTVPFSALSKGNRQKVIIAQALLPGPPMLVLDEPFGGLDGSARRALDVLLAEAQTSGASVIISAHSAGPRSEDARTLRIANGRLTQETHSGPPVDGPGEHRRVDLVDRANRGADTIRALPGVVQVEADPLAPSAVTARVEAEHVDAFLVAVLEMGWSVGALGPDTAGARGPGEVPDPDDVS